MLQSEDGVTFFGSDCLGRQLLVRLVRRTGRQAELLLLLQADGHLYQLPGKTRECRSTPASELGMGVLNC